MTIIIDVIGIPRPGGGKIAGFNKKTGKGFVRPDNPKTATWRSDVQMAAFNQYEGPILDGPLSMSYLFRFPRPKCHYRTGKNSHLLRENAPKWHTTKPDLTKIIRSTEDALTGITYRDDSLICIRHEQKRYCNDGERPGCFLMISKWHDVD